MMASNQWVLGRGVSRAKNENQEEGGAFGERALLIAMAPAWLWGVWREGRCDLNPLMASA